MIVDYIIVILFLIILIRIIKIVGIYKFIGAGLIIVLVYLVMRLSGKEIDAGYYFGVIVMASLAIMSYETFKNFSHHESRRKTIAAGLIFALQIVTSFFLLIYAIRTINDLISRYFFIGEIVARKNAISVGDGLVIPFSIASILVIINLTAFLLVQHIRKMH